MSKNIIIIGKHPLAENLIRQYEAKGHVVARHQELTAEGICLNDYDELCLLAGDGEDDKAIALLGQLVTGYDVQSHGGKRIICHLLVQSQATLQMLQTTDFCEAIRERADIYPFTTDEAWCRSIVLDYEPITLQSEKHVRLVIFGMGEIAQMVAIQAALVAHYPNYTRDHSLRTRITFIDEQAETKSRGFIQRYQHLFDNSYYRVVRPSEEKAVVKFHRPMYEGRREDFVDVEWEFVEAEAWNADLREKLQLWAHDEGQLLTVVLAHDDDDKNAALALLMPNELYQRSIPIHKHSRHYMEYDVTLPLVRMAKNVNYIYDRCYAENDAAWNGQLRSAVEIDKEELERSWARLKNVKRMSSMFSAMTIPSKMRSVGIEDNDWDKYYDISQQDIEILSEVEHNRWSVEELILGFRPCSDHEQDIIAADVATQKNAYKTRKIHYDLRAYNELRPDGTGKPVQVYDRCLCACLPLIAKAFADEEGGGA